MVRALVLLLAIGSASCAAGGAGDLRRDPIAAALREMPTIPANAFVIVEDPRSGAFVQFTVDDRDRLLIDLPVVALDDEAAARAKAFFAAADIPLVTTSATDPRTGEEFRTESYQKTFDPAAVDEVAALALEIFAEVHRLPDVEHGIVKGWE